MPRAQQAGREEAREARAGVATRDGASRCRSSVPCGVRPRSNSRSSQNPRGGAPLPACPRPPPRLVDGSAWPGPSWCSACEAQPCRPGQRQRSRPAGWGHPRRPGASLRPGAPGCRVRPQAGCRSGAKGQKQGNKPLFFRASHQLTLAQPEILRHPELSQASSAVARVRGSQASPGLPLPTTAPKPRASPPTQRSEVSSGDGVRGLR